MTDVDVLIIGAGQAGMAAAHRLWKNRRTSVHVIEAHLHVGGRTRNFDVNTQRYDTATDDAVELGGTWISPDHTAFLNLCHELNIDLFRSSFIDEANEAVASSKEDVVDDDTQDEWPWWYWGSEYTEQEIHAAPRTIFHHCPDNSEHAKFSFSNPSELMSQLDESTQHDLDKVGNIIQNTAAHLKDLSWDASKPGARWSEVDSLTTGAKLMSSLKTNAGRNVLRSVIHDRNAQEPEQVGFLYNMLSFKGCNSSGAGSEFRVHGGTQAVPLTIATKLGRERPTLGDAVRSVRLVYFSANEQSKQIEVITKSGKVFTSKALIVTGSPPAILGIDFDPQLPQVQAQLLQRMPMGSSRKFIAVYKRGPWWRRFGYTGDILASGLPRELSLSIGVDYSETEERVPVFGPCYDTSPFSQTCGVLTCFVEGRQNLYFSNLAQEEQRDLMHQFLKLTFQDLELESDSDKELWEPDFYVTHNWSDDPYARGAYTAYFPPGVLSVPEWWEAYRTMEKLPNVFLAGADYHTGFGNGYIEGAVRSGQLAADLVSTRLSTN